MTCRYPYCEAGDMGTHCKSDCLPVKLTSDKAAAQEPPCATQECMPSQCPNCASLQDQNTELDRKLAEMERKLLELQAAVLQSQGIRSGDA